MEPQQQRHLEELFGDIFGDRIGGVASQQPLQASSSMEASVPDLLEEDRPEEIAASSLEPLPGIEPPALQDAASLPLYNVAFPSELLCQVGCEYKTKSLDDLIAHLKSHQKENTKCQWRGCEAISRNRKCTVAHYKLHSTERSQCLKCNYWGGKLGSLQDHERKSHGGVPQSYKRKVACKTRSLKEAAGTGNDPSV